MKISVAQIRPVKGNISANIDKHINFIILASSLDSTSIFFPELSLTGYEPLLARDLSMTQDDERLDCFQQMSDAKKITIGLGIPGKTEIGIQISMVVFQPGKPRQTYSKQQLHPDEFPYFMSGDRQVVLTVEDKKIVPAICFESLQSDHADKANKLGANIYLASVAKSQKGVDAAFRIYPEVAKKYAMPVLMSNCVGFCDNSMSIGFSSVWTKNGKLGEQLDDQNEGIIVFDTETEIAVKCMMGEQINLNNKL